MSNFDEYLDALRSDGAEFEIKIELLDKNESVIEDITPDFADGSVNIAYQNGSRRNANISLDNPDNKYAPDHKGRIWADTKIKISSGLNGVVHSNGIFCLVEPETSSYFSDTSASLSLSDKWSLLDGSLGGTLANDYIIPVGSNIGDAVRNIIVNEIKDVKAPIIWPTTVTSPYTLTINRDDNFGDMLIKLAEMISYECFYDKNGQFRFQPVGEDDKKASVWDFSTNEVTYLGSSRRFDFSQLKNAIYVNGDNILGSQIAGVAKDNYLFSPTYVGRLGERVRTVNDDIINTIDLANQRAAYELRKSIIIQETTSLESVAIYHIDVGDIITIEDEGNNLARSGININRYIVSGIDLSLDVGSSMRVNVWKNRPLE